MNIAKQIFSVHNLVWFFAMGAITVFFALFGIDAWWLTHVRGTDIARVFGLAGMVGFFVPVLAWAALLVAGIIAKSERTRLAAWTIAVAGTSGWILSSLLKFFTGRPGLPHGAVTNALELSQTFHFGFGAGGIFWGWPSSHTTVAFAMSVALAMYYHDKKWIGITAIIYAIYIGIGATGFHWASDVVAGVILGVLIGCVTGNFFRKMIGIDGRG